LWWIPQFEPQTVVNFYKFVQKPSSKLTPEFMVARNFVVNKSVNVFFFGQNIRISHDAIHNIHRQDGKRTHGEIGLFLGLKKMFKSNSIFFVFRKKKLNR